jgi:hypothetical protein
MSLSLRSRVSVWWECAVADSYLGEGVVMVGAGGSMSTVVSYRCSSSLSLEARDWRTVDLDALGSALPWRTFRWYQGQKHYSGVFWSATEQDHVIYESRLELARLMFADFDSSVHHIVAQPFLLRAEVAGAVRKHIPDYLLVTDTGPIVVDVKPRHRVDSPDNAFTFTWTRQVVEARGWRYEVWSEPPSVVLENVRFLAGYRRGWLFDPELVAELGSADLDGLTLGVACRSRPGRSAALVRAALLHLVWRQHFTVDLTRRLSSGHVLRRAS